MTTPIQPVPDLVLASEFPSLADRPAGTYNAKAKAWADSENAMVTRARETALVTHNNALAAREAADEAVPAAATAVAARDKALEYKESAEAIAGAIGDDAGLPSLVGNARKALAVNDDEDAVGWYSVIPTIGVRQVDDAADIGAVDQAIMVRCDGSFTLSFDSVASLPTGWFCYVKNSGAGDITLEPASSETIDGLTSYIMYPGECRLFAHNGVELVSVVLNSFRRVFTTSGAFVKPPGYRSFGINAVGGGGSGSVSTSGTGGGGGGAFVDTIPESLLSATETVTIGSGGSAVSTSAGAGVAGGNTTLGSVVVAYGGAGGDISAGYAVANLSAGSAQRATFGSIVNPSSFAAIQLLQPGGMGGSGPSVTEGITTVGGGGGGGRNTASMSALGGQSLMHGDGGRSAYSDGSIQATAGQIPGGGGGAGDGSGYPSGAGARGELQIWGII